MLYGNQGSETAFDKKLLAELLVQNQAPEIYPASLSQERLWFLNQLSDPNAAYNVHVGLWLNGPLDISALQAGLREIVARHDTLRTTFQFFGGQLFQAVSRRTSVNLPMDEVVDAPDPIRRAYELASHEVHCPFDLATGPLFRARLIRVSPEEHVFLCTMHHIVTDSWSMQLFVRELSTLYAAFSEGRPSPLQELPISYGDYAEWQRKWSNGELVSQEIDYWKKRLQGAPKLLELPTDAPRPVEQTFSGASQTVILPDAAVADVKQLAARYNCTPFMVLLAVFKLLLYRLSRQPDVLVGVPVAGRDRVESESLIGFFVNTLVLRDNLAGNPTFLELLWQVRETTLSAFANADVPFEKIVEVLQPERSLSYNPFFQVMFSAIKAALPTHAFANLTAYPYVVSPSTSIFDLSATLIETSDGQWCMQFEYNTDLFSAERVGQMLVDYTGIVCMVANHPETRIREVAVSGTESKAPTLVSEAPGPASVRQISDSMATGFENDKLIANRNLLLQIWKEVLGLSYIGIYDNFFDLGGHSLLAARLVREVESATHRKIRVAAIFRAPTIAALARLLTETSTPDPEPMVMELCRGRDSNALFAVAIPGVETFGFGLLARQLTGDHSVYKLQAAEPVILDRPFDADELRSLAHRYLAAMRSVQPHGPYALAAMCDGVVLAQAIIVALEAEGERVNLFTIFDTWVLENSMRRPLWAVDYYLQRLRYLINCPARDQWATVKRSIRRLAKPDQQQNGSGWKRAYWPGEHFQAPRFRSPVLLFKRPRQPYYYVRDPQMGWGQRTSGGVDVFELECGHLDMLREPYVRAVAEKIACRLRASIEGNELGGSVPASVERSGALLQQSAA